LLAVSRPYSAERTTWPAMADYHFRGRQHELRIFLDRATPAEVSAIASGPVEFGFFTEPAGLFLIIRFGPSLSFNCPYHWHRVAEATGDRTTPSPSEETSPTLRALFHIILVEATTGLVLALRTVSFSPEFTRAIHRAIADQAVAPYDRGKHEQWVDALQCENTTGQLWARCSVRCQGGE
jgi:hypothetical protein